MSEFIKKMRIFIIFLIMILSSQCLLSAEDSKENNSQIEIFIQGESYDNLREYQLSKLRQLILKQYSFSSQVEIDAIMSEIKPIISTDEYRNITEKDVREVMRNILKEKGSAVVIENEEDVDDVDLMLKNYYEKHSDLEEIKLNPDEMKTIIINPKHDLEH